MEIGEGVKVLLKLEKTLEDKSRYGRTTTIGGTVTPNYNNEGILINSGYLILDTNIKNVITNKDFILSLDVCPISTNDGSHFVLASMGGSNTIGGDIYFVPNTNEIIYYAGGVRIKTAITFTHNRWYHVEWRREGGMFKLHVDGGLLGTTDYQVTQNVSDFVIGANQSAYSETMNGYVKNIVIKLL